MPVARGRRTATRPLFVGGLLLVLGSALALVDYVRVAEIFMPPQDGTPLSERIAAGRRTWLFAHHADYAAVTTDERSVHGGPAFKEAPHYLMDTRLTIAWAKALARAGELDKARHLAQRLREFRNPLADEFFEVCDEPRTQAPRPFQCEAPARVPDWREFLMSAGRPPGGSDVAAMPTAPRPIRPTCRRSCAAAGCRP